MLRWGKAGRVAAASNEHGAAMAEYTPLLAVIAVLVVLAVSFIGPWVREQLVDASVPLHGCPPPFSLTREVKNHPGGVDRDLNGDGWYCIQQVPGGGNGNNGHSFNIKDNNRGPGS